MATQHRFGLLWVLSVLFSTACCQYGQTNGCNMDLVFVIDTNSVLENTQYIQYAINFIVDIVNTLAIGPSNTQVGLVTISDNANVLFRLNSTRNSIISAVQSITCGTQGTNIASGLTKLTSDLFTSSYGDRLKFPNVAVVILGMPASQEQYSTFTSAQAAWAAGINIFSIGIDTALENEVQGISSYPQAADKNYYVVNDSSLMSFLESMLITNMCSVVTSFNSASSRSLGGSTTTTLATETDTMKLTPTASHDDSTNVSISIGIGVGVGGFLLLAAGAIIVYVIVKKKYSKHNNEKVVSKVQQCLTPSNMNADGLYTELQKDFQHEADRQYSKLQVEFKQSLNRDDEGKYSEVLDSLSHSPGRENVRSYLELQGSFKESPVRDGEEQYTELQDINDTKYPAGDAKRQDLCLQGNHNGNMRNNHSQANHATLLPSNVSRNNNFVDNSNASNSDFLRQDSSYLQPIECSCSNTISSDFTTLEVEIGKEKMCRRCHKSLSTLTVPTARGSDTVFSNA